jgi:hypothetical protein
MVEMNSQWQHLEVKRQSVGTVASLVISPLNVERPILTTSSSRPRTVQAVVVVVAIVTINGILCVRNVCLAVNASKRLAGWRPPAGYRPGGGGATGEHGQATLDIDSSDCNGYELMMCQMTFPQHQDMLQDYKIWIADSGASTHSTGAHMNGMVNVRKGKSSDSMVVGNNQVNVVQSIGDIPGVFYDKYGTAGPSATLTNVSYSRDNAFNLLSIPQLLMRGWSLGGNTECITVTSPDGIVINFDIIIPTKEGHVYATCFQ